MGRNSAAAAPADPVVDSPKSDLELVAYLHAEAETRRTLRQIVKMVDISSAPTEHATRLAALGTVSIILGYEGNALFEGIYNSIERDLEEAGHALQSIRPVFESRTRRPLAEAVDIAKQCASLADVRYLTKTLAFNLPVLDDPGVTIINCPYVGINLSQNELFIVEKYHDFPRLKCLAIVRAPHLNEIELAALRLLPPGNIEQTVVAPTLCYAATGVGIAMVVIAATSFCRRDDYLTELRKQAAGDRPVDPERTVLDLLRQRRALDKTL